ncbi:MAG TPA: serine/threonine-protein kinase, partial [Thermoanaerobaculia bacterium]|nr:serine/threonine-protein kinase [Thermoanaerobaculia bacterium]
MHLLDQPDRWRRVDALFTELLDLGPLAREERLATLAAEDPSLRRDLEALLRLDAEESGLLDRSAALLAANLLATDAELAAAAARIPTPPEEQLSGRRLAHFLVGEPLGAGGMGVVYRAFDESLHRTVALKFLTLRASRERLLKEARAASALSHPGIVVIHEVGSAEGLDFIAMELVDGTTLQRRIPQQGLPVELAVDYAIQVADALARAHAHGIIHRDLKP